MHEMNQIYADRLSALYTYMEAKNFSCLMFLEPGFGNWDQWLPDAAAPDGPNGPSVILPPFNRNNLYLVPRGGGVAKRTALQPHPTDPFQFPQLNVAKDKALLGDGPVGVVNMDALMESVRTDLMENCPDLTLVDVTRDLDVIKASKSPLELVFASEAAKAFDRAFAALPLILRIGKTEHNIAVNFRERLAAVSISAEDLNELILLELTSAPDGGHTTTSTKYPGRQLAFGDRIHLLANGYGSTQFACAMGRCFTIGSASEETKRWWALAVQAQDLAAQSAKPGTTIRDLLNLIKEQILRPNGLAEDHAPSIYGLGCYRYEAPRSCDQSVDMPLTEGMVLAIGPRIHPVGKDTFCCMDPFLITPSGGVRLSRTPRNITELV